MLLTPYSSKNKIPKAGGEGKERKVRSSRPVLTLPRYSSALITKLFSIKIQTRKLGAGLSGSSLYSGQPCRKDLPPSILPSLWEKYKRPSLSALSGNYKAFPGTGLKSVYVS